MIKRVLIAVKTYPTLSEKYNELVCTAGFLEDGSWIRIYPIQYRLLNYEQKYKKWSYIDINIEKNTGDFRAESYRPINLKDNIKVLPGLGCENDWSLRKRIVLKNATDDLKDLIYKAKNKNISLAVYKPTSVKDFVWEETSREWDKEKLERVKANLSYPDLFEERNTFIRTFEVVRKIPYKFSYIFKSKDDTTHKMMIEDWELGTLYWKYIDKGYDENATCNIVKEKFFKWMKNRDLYFMLGTTLKYAMAKNPFIIIGTFYPPIQLNFDFE